MVQTFCEVVDSSVEAGILYFCHKISVVEINIITELQMTTTGIVLTMNGLNRYGDVLSLYTKSFHLSPIVNRCKFCECK